MPWANQILPAAGVARAILAEEDDAASVVSVASSGAPSRQRAGESDSDASQLSEVADQDDQATVVEVLTDEDESEAESEEELNLVRKSNDFCMKPMRPMQPQGRGGYSNESIPQQVVEPPLQEPEMCEQFLRNLLISQTAGLSCEF